MKKHLQKSLLIALITIPNLWSAQIDLTIGLNYAYTGPSNCNNKITNLEFDVCNNGSDPASTFEVGVYIYDPSSSNKWIIASTTINSLSGNTCKTISNWDIDMNNFCCLPSAGTNYRLGAWADTANAITESTKNNNATLLSGNIQICGTTTGIKDPNKETVLFDIYPNPTQSKTTMVLNFTDEKPFIASVFDTQNREIMTIYNGPMARDNQKIIIPSDQLKPGVYFVRLNILGAIATKKLIVQE